SPKRR
ncbi:paraquat-inducible B domain protein, partial [Vibrio parahaemolyticus EKP-021]